MRGRAMAVAVAMLLPACGTDGGVQPVPHPGTSTPTPGKTDAVVAVSVYFPNEQLGDVCDEVFAVERLVPAAAPLRGALEQLLAGPTPAEREAGYGGWFSQATARLLAAVRVDGGRAFVDLGRGLPDLIPNASSSCGSFALLGMLDATTTQFPDIDEAWYSLEGDRADFYGWLQLVAPDDPGLQPSPSPSADPTVPEPTSPAATQGTPPPTTPTSAREVPGSLRGTEWMTLPGDARRIALTFDAGANADGVPSILSTLAAEDVPATFFLTGRWVTAYPTHAAEIGRRYPVGNHTLSHPDLTTLGNDAVRSEILAAHDAIAAATGRDPRPWFRFPFGARDDRAIDIVNDLGYGSVRWTTDTLGWKGTSTGQSVASVTDRVLGDLQPGQIVLMHVGSHPTDGSTLDADSLGELIRRIRGAGYDFVDLDELLANP